MRPSGTYQGLLEGLSCSLDSFSCSSYNLQEPALACQSFSASLRPTVQTAFPAIEFMQEKWETMAKLPKYATVAAGLQWGTDNLHKWYHNMDDTDIYFLSLVLDPCIKMEYFKVHWDSDYLQKGMKTLDKVFDYYSAKVDNVAGPKEPANTNGTPLEDADGATNMGYSSAWMRHAVQARVQAKNANADPRREVKEYLAGPLNVTIPHLGADRTGLLGHSGFICFR